MTRIKQMNCVGCPKFCQNEDAGALKRLMEKFKIQGYEEIKFNCRAGNSAVEKFRKFNGYKNI